MGNSINISLRTDSDLKNKVDKLKDEINMKIKVLQAYYW